MFCQHCGKTLPDVAKFCQFCGAPVQYNAGPEKAPEPVPKQQPAFTVSTASTASFATTAAPNATPVTTVKKQHNVAEKVVLIAVICAVLWAIWSLYIKKPDTTTDPDIFDSGTIPEDVRVIVNEASFLSGDYQMEEYTFLQDQFSKDIDDALRKLEPEVYIVSTFPYGSPTLDGADMLGQEFGYPYFWLKNYSVSTERVDWNGKKAFGCRYKWVYSDDAENMAEMQSQIDVAVDSYLRLIPANADKWHAVKIIHDELVRRVAYDHSLSETHAHDIYGALVENSAVCQGYTYAFSYLMMRWNEKTGVQANGGYNYYPCVVTDNHGWNNINELTYESNIDVTWDDPDLYDKYGNPYILYNYFGLTTDEIKQIDDHAEVKREGGQLEIPNPETYNYHKHEGYYLYSFDLNAITAVLSEQYRTGTNVLTVRFENQSDFDRIMTWTNSGADECHKALQQIGYNVKEGLGYLPNETLKTFNILLNYSTPKQN